MPAKEWKRAKKDHSGGELRWMLTYSDMITLLLALFIVLYALNNQTPQKLQMVEQALSHNLVSHSLIGKAPGPSFVPGLSGRNTPTSLSSTTLSHLQQKLQQAVNQAGLQNQVLISSNPLGVRITLAAALLFKSGHAALNPIAQQLLIHVGTILNTVPDNPIEVIGYTDSTPENSAKYPSNWQLGAMRAANVTDALTQAPGFNPLRLMQVSFSKYRPLTTNSTAAGRAQNRRVDILVLHKKIGKILLNVSPPIIATHSPEVKS